MNKRFFVILSLIFLIRVCAFAQANVVPGGGGLQELTPEQLQANNQRASQFIQNFSDFSSSQRGSAVVEAARAEVQVVRKCLVGIAGDGYVIGHQSSLYCPGHPLSGLGSPTPDVRGGSTTQSLAGPTSEGCGESRSCSGFLVSNQQTIGTAGHCLQGRSVTDFCNEFVFVFNRTGDKTTFSQDEVFGCDGGVGTDTSQTVTNFNMHADQGTRDHAFLHLSRPVPQTTARPLTVRQSRVTAGESLFAVGHPQGNPRMVSSLSTHANLGGNPYSYIHSEGYVYPGQSGGPLLDQRGQVVGIMAAVDDKRYGNEQAREPMVRTNDKRRFCKTQVAGGSVITEAITFGADVRRDLEQGSQAPSAETPISIPTVE